MTKAFCQGTPLSPLSFHPFRFGCFWTWHYRFGSCSCHSCNVWWFKWLNDPNVWLLLLYMFWFIIIELNFVFVGIQICLGFVMKSLFGRYGDVVLVPLHSLQGTLDWFFFYVMLGCQGVVKLVFQGNPNVYSLSVQQIENPRFRFGSPLIWLNSFNCSYGRQRANLYDLKPVPEGVPRPMCFCGDPCKVDISEDEETYRQRYWMCPNYAWEPTKQQRRASIVRNFYCVLIHFLVILSIAYLFVL